MTALHRIDDDAYYMGMDGRTVLLSMDLMRVGFWDKRMYSEILLTHSQLLEGWLANNRQAPGPNHHYLWG